MLKSGLLERERKRKSLWVRSLGFLVGEGWSFVGGRCSQKGRIIKGLRTLDKVVRRAVEEGAVQLKRRGQSCTDARCSDMRHSASVGVGDR